MPTISDPGYQLVKRAHEENIAVAVVPGPTALVSALALSGLPTDSFLFAGFLNRSSVKRQQQLEKIKDEERTLVFYEAPHRLKDFLADVLNIFGDRACFIVRELTKKYEEYFRGSVSELLSVFQKREPKGEFVVIIAADRKETDKKEQKTEFDYQKLAALLKDKGLSNKDIVDIIATLSGMPRNVLKKELF